MRQSHPITLRELLDGIRREAATEERSANVQQWAMELAIRLCKAAFNPHQADPSPIELLIAAYPGLGAGSEGAMRLLSTEQQEDIPAVLHVLAEQMALIVAEPAGEA